MKNRIVVAIALLALFSSGSVHAVEIEGVRVDDKTAVATSELVLNGAGVRGRFDKRYVIALDWILGKGTQLTSNGQPVGKTILGEDFYVALLKVWLGKEPVQDDLKLGLLGLSP